jgi:hypothetical protein
MRLKSFQIVLSLLAALSLAGCGGGKSGGNNLGITGYTFEDVVGAMGETAKINDHYIATWPGFEILPGGGTRRMNLQIPATVDGFAVDPRATLIDVNASGQFLAELFLPDSPEYSEVAALLSEDAPIILPYPPGHRQRSFDQIQPNTVVARSLNNAGQALVNYGGLEPGKYLVTPSSIQLANHLGVLAAGGTVFGNSPDGPPQEVPTRLVNGVPVPLFDPIEGQFPVISAVSDSGTAVGTLTLDPGDNSHPVSIWIWTEAEGARFIPIERRWNRVVPTDVNNLGVVIGWYDLEDPAQPGAKPFIILGHQFIALESLTIAPEGTFLGPGISINNNNAITQSANGLKLGRSTP